LAERLAHAHGLRLVEDWPMPLLGVNCFVMEVPADRSVDRTAEELAQDPGVGWSQPLHLYHTQGAAPQVGKGGAGKGVSSKDPLFAAQPAARAWRLADLHKVATGRGVTVAVIDSQVETTHPDLAGQIAVSENFAATPARGGEQHGTAVAGVIAAKADNGQGVVGVAPGARLMALRACWERGDGSGATVCDSISLAKALSFGVERRAQVINLSLSGPPDILLGRLIDVGLERGITIVAAYDPRAPHGGFPASHPGVISVADESMAAPRAGVYVAPGRDVPTSKPGGRWSLVNGSSYAAAHVSGLAALVRERTRRGRIMLVSTAAGGGGVEACATLLRTPPACDCVCAPSREARR
jgi:hypothetical protein